MRAGGLSRRRCLALVLALVAGVVWLSPRTMKAQAPAQPPFKGGVEAVTVDVTVVDPQGRPAADLGSGDFTVTVAGRPRRVVSATYLGTTPGDVATEALVPPVSTNDDVPAVGRMVVFVVDQATLDHTEIRQVGRCGPAFPGASHAGGSVRARAHAGRRGDSVHRRSRPRAGSTGASQRARHHHDGSAQPRDGGDSRHRVGRLSHPEQRGRARVLRPADAHRSVVDRSVGSGRSGERRRRTSASECALGVRLEGLVHPADRSRKPERAGNSCAPTRSRASTRCIRSCRGSNRSTATRSSCSSPAAGRSIRGTATPS